LCGNLSAASSAGILDPQSMTPGQARRILESLADGVCPATGKRLPDGSPYQNANVIRALFLAIRVMERMRNDDQPIQSAAMNANDEWSEEADEELCELFADGDSLKSLARRFCCTREAARDRLVALGKLEPRKGTKSSRANSIRDTEDDETEEIPF